jgi:hypothetical protein
MKRLAMDLESPPIDNLPSYLDLVKGSRRGVQQMLPRWWLAPYYEPLRTDPEGLSWEIRGQAVRCMTEDDFVGREGTRQASGRSSPAATQWANNMTTHFDALAAKDSVFGQLRNLMDLAVVAALIHKYSLLDRASLRVPYLSGEEPIVSFQAPRQVETKGSFVKKGRNWMISASGGIQILPYDVLDKSEASDELAPARQATANPGDRWWWD